MQTGDFLFFFTFHLMFKIIYFTPTPAPTPAPTHLLTPSRAHLAPPLLCILNILVIVGNIGGAPEIRGRNHGQPPGLLQD